MKKLLLFTLLLGSVMLMSCKKGDEPTPNEPVKLYTDTTKKDTTHKTPAIPKVYAEIWVLNKSKSNSNIFEFDSLKVTNRTTYQMNNGDHCYNLFCDTVKNSAGELYVPEMFVNLDQGLVTYTVGVLSPNARVVTYYMYNGGVTVDKEINFIFKETEPYVANTSIVYDQIK